MSRRRFLTIWLAVVTGSLVLAIHPAPAATEEPVAIDGGFAYRDVEFALMPPNEVLGTVLNKSGRDYQSACFVVKLYNKTDQLLKTNQFCLQEFPDGESKTFSLATNTNPTTVKGYKIQFVNGKLREAK
jgi:hypothetical protein